MSTPIEEFIRQTFKQFNVKYALTNAQVRKIRYKLAQADIEGTVDPSDVKLAQNIVLADVKKSSGNLRTAAATNGMHNAFSLRNAGSCPRCGQGMTFAKLAESNEVRFCPSCNVCIP